MSVMLISVAVSVYLEQTYAWASRISGAVIALIFALVLVNTNIIPPHAELYDDIVWGYVVPIAIPLLLLQTNIVKIWRETGRLLVIFLIGAAGTICGALIDRLCASRLCHRWSAEGSSDDDRLLYRRRCELYGTCRCL